MTNATLPELIVAANQNSERAREIFGAFTPAQLNWKPGAERWSVAQCLDHLITTNSRYSGQLEAILKGEKTSSLWEKLPLLPRLWGKLLLQSVSPHSPLKLKTEPVFEPAASDVDGSIVRRFLEHQEWLVARMKAIEAQGLKADSIVLTSPAKSFVTYSLLDTFRILVAHEQRHLLQAQRVTESPGFPAGPA